MTRHTVFQRDDVLYVLPDPGQYDDDRVRFAISMRNAATLAGACSVCGAVATMPNRAERRRAKASGKPMTRAMVHDGACPVGDDALRALFAETAA